MVSNRGKKPIYHPTRLILFLISFASTCFILPSLHAAAPTLTRVVFSFGGLNERSGVLFVARDQGLFQKHGLDAQIVHVRGAALGMPALASGEIHLYLGSATGASIGAMAGGLDLVFIAGLISKPDGYFVVIPQIKSPSDLKGKTIGVQSMGGGVWMLTMLAFEHWGLNPERDRITIRVVGDQSVSAQAMATGLIDGSYLGYTFGSNMERQGFRILADLAKIGVPYQGIGLIARRSFVERSPEVTEKALRAIAETVMFIHNPKNKTTVMQSLAKALRLQRVEDAETGYEMMKALYERRIYPTAEGLRNVINLLGRTNESIRRLKAEDLIENRFLRKLESEGLF